MRLLKAIGVFFLSLLVVVILSWLSFFVSPKIAQTMMSVSPLAAIGCAVAWWKDSRGKNTRGVSPGDLGIDPGCVEEIQNDGRDNQ